MPSPEEHSCRMARRDFCAVYSIHNTCMQSRPSSCVGLLLFLCEFMRLSSVQPAHHASCCIQFIMLVAAVAGILIVIPRDRHPYHSHYLFIIPHSALSVGLNHGPGEIPSMTLCCCFMLFHYPGFDLVAVVSCQTSQR